MGIGTGGEGATAGTSRVGACILRSPPALPADVIRNLQRSCPPQRAGAKVSLGGLPFAMSSF
jgi:hypothetical protein